jgi:hypothetical protein
MEDTLERCTTQTKDWSSLPSIPWIKLGNKEWKWVEPSSFFDVLPEVLDACKAFWSIMLYDQHHFFAPNALERFSLGTKSKQLHYEADGSLVVHVQSDRPGEDRVSNWLPAPRGEFSLYIRAYWPLAAIQEGHWTAPPGCRLSFSSPQRGEEWPPPRAGFTAKRRERGEEPLSSARDPGCMLNAAFRVFFDTPAKV